MLQIKNVSHKAVNITLVSPVQVTKHSVHELDNSKMVEFVIQSRENGTKLRIDFEDTFGTLYKLEACFWGQRSFDCQGKISIRNWYRYFL